ncbi:MAG TPA: hypothetical protein VK607_10075, partial [Kofleriaceae bacterium]|nr:hypothetical protein [Kofleriaceae bacterium]
GIGVALGEEISGRREMYITQVFTRVPPKLDPAVASETLRQKVAAANRVVSRSTTLQEIAQQFAEALAAGRSREDAYQLVRRRLDGVGKLYQRFGTVITATGNLDVLDGAALVGDSVVDEVAVGVAQGVHPDIGEGAFWIVLLLANRRVP